jgi:hypothetical protein
MKVEDGECSKGIGFVVGNGARGGSGDGHKKRILDFIISGLYEISP